MAVVEISAHPQVPQLLVIGNGVHLLAVAETPAVLARIQIFTHAHKILFRETVAGKSHLAVQLIETLRIAEAV